jgi:hypothetical protein
MFDQFIQIYFCRFPLHFSLSSIGDDEQPTTIEINYFFCKVPFVLWAWGGMCPHCPLWASLRCIIASTMRRGQDRRGATSRGWSRCAHLQRIVRRYVLVDMLTDLTEICLGEYVVYGALELLELLLRRCLSEYVVWGALRFLELLLQLAHQFFCALLQLAHQFFCVVRHISTTVHIMMGHIHYPAHHEVLLVGGWSLPPPLSDHPSLPFLLFFSSYYYSTL